MRAKWFNNPSDADTMLTCMSSFSHMQTLNTVNFGFSGQNMVSTCECTGTNWFSVRLIK